MQVILGQIDIQWEDVAANVAKVASGLEQVRPGAGSLVVLPEMFASGFSMEPARACRDWEQAYAALGGLASRWGCWLAAGLAMEIGTGPANMAVGFGPDGREWFRFRKLHGFSPVGEPAVYGAGSEVGVWPMGAFRVAPFLCYDLRFPEVFRRAAVLGADLMLVLANWPARRERHWLTLLQARAIENQCWVIGVNRAGADPQATYSGRSVIIDPTGVVRHDAGEGERWTCGVIDAEEARAWRGCFPALRDRRDWTWPRPGAVPAGD